MRWITLTSTSSSSSSSSAFSYASFSTLLSWPLSLSKSEMSGSWEVVDTDDDESSDNHNVTALDPGQTDHLDLDLIFLLFLLSLLIRFFLHLALIF